MSIQTVLAMAAAGAIAHGSQAEKTLRNHSDLFDARRKQSFWDGLLSIVPVWDKLIDEFNAGSASV